MVVPRLALVALGLHGAAFGDDVPTYAGDDGTKYGRAHIVVQPDYPEAALRERTPGAIVVMGAVNAQGEMEAPNLAPEDAASAVFVEPLRKVLRFWSFYTPVGRDCMPSSRPIKVRVEFKAGDGHPHVYLVYAAPDSMPYDDWPAIKPVETPRLRFTRAMLAHGGDALVYARIVVDADGRAGEVVTRAYPKAGDASGLEPFAREVKDGLGRLRFAPDASHPARYVCYTVEFNRRG